MSGEATRRPGPTMTRMRKAHFGLVLILGEQAQPLRRPASRPRGESDYSAGLGGGGGSLLFQESLWNTGTLTAGDASHQKAGSGMVTKGDYSGPGQSNLVIYCVYSAR